MVHHCGIPELCESHAAERHRNMAAQSPRLRVWVILDRIVGTTLGYSLSSQFTGPFAGPLIGGFVGGHVGMRAVFLATALLMLASALYARRAGAAHRATRSLGI